MKNIILGSSSPRRKEILEFFTLPFEQQSPNFDEESVRYDGNPQEYVEQLANEKGKELAKKNHHALIITADTMVVHEQKLLGKPKTEEDARLMLALLSGRWHSVFTAVAVTSDHQSIVFTEETKVLCNTITPHEAHEYLRAHNLYDKAGSYAIQKSGSLLVKEISGCYYNVMGLPVNALRKALLFFNIDLWNHLKPF
jgi:septum formation protein